MTSELYDRIDALERAHRYCACTGTRPCTVYEAAYLALAALVDDQAAVVCDQHGPRTRCPRCVDDTDDVLTFAPPPNAGQVGRPIGGSRR